MTRVYIRKLRYEDHLVSYMWRNNPVIWEYTGLRPDLHVTEQMEAEWSAKVLGQDNSLRYAICVEGTDEYIGNVQITDIKDGKGEFHIFIGNTDYWGKGVGMAATSLMVEQAFATGLDEVYLFVHTHNTAAVKIYRKCGFEVTEETNDKLRMAVTPAKFQPIKP